MGVKAHLGVDDLGECLAAAGDVLEPVRRPFHRTPKFFGGDAQQNLFGIQRSLGAEAAADVRSDDAKTAARKVEQIRQRVTHDAGYVR